MQETVELSIVMPCLNEAETLALCIQKAQRMLQENGISGEIIVADNGSIDGSQDIALAYGAKVVHVRRKGYGNALTGGVSAAQGRYIIMGDADDSYNFTDLIPFVEKLREGYDLVMGNRFRGMIKPGAMPFLNRYIGNPVLTAIGRLFFGSPISDFHCGLRGFSKVAFERMDLQTSGMEFASEMVVKASLLKMHITEVPTSLSPDGRSRPPHLRRWRDGWRHLRFMLLYSPRWLFLYPGVLLILFGSAAMLWLLPGPRKVGSVVFDVHTLLYASMAILIGFQGIAFALFSKMFAISEKLLPENSKQKRLFRYVSLEKGLVIGALLIVLGFGGSIYSIIIWNNYSFGPLETTKMLRNVIPSLLALVLGCHVILISFLISVFSLPRKNSKVE